MSLAWEAYRLLAPAVGALAPAARAFTSPQERELWSERLGEVDRPDGCDAWIHAASMGEALGVGPLVRELAALQPGARFHLTATTRTGRARLASLGPGVSLAPIDAPQTVRRFFGGIRPRRLILFETELWPHWLLQARAERIPVAVVSARLSERSTAHYRGLGPPLAGLVSGLGAVLCQSEADAARWLRIGARPDRTAVVGNLKNDALPSAAPSRGAARAALGLDRDRPLLVLGSVRPGEAVILGRAWAALPAELREGWQVVAVPRHARVTGDLRAEANRGLRARSGRGASRDPARAAYRSEPWRWDDRPGVLAAYYAAADAAFVGGSLVNYGGHNPLEPAACGAAVIMGVHHDSQRDAVARLRKGGAIRVVAGAAALRDTFRELLGDPARRDSLAAAARAVADEGRGAAGRAADRLAILGFWPVS